MAHGRHRKLVETLCSGCLVEISAWHGDTPDQATIDVFLFSNHVGEWQRSWRGRLLLAWRALRGEHDDGLGLLDRDAVDEFIRALQEAREAVWGPAGRK